MFLNRTIKNKSVLLCLVFALFFNSVGTLFAASSLLSQAKTFSNKDVELICTGSTFKWMSVSIFEQTGEIQFVEPPENAPEGFEHIKCSYSYLNDNSSNQALFTQQTTLEFVTLTNPVIDYINAQYTAQKHQLATSRAPPTKMQFAA